MATIKCASCGYLQAIVSYVIRNEGHCVCPHCDHIWVQVAQEIGMPPQKLGTP
jgi:Zn finger protein HypA/HybF involved in hydrogenase expression